MLQPTNENYRGKRYEAPAQKDGAGCDAMQARLLRVALQGAQVGTPIQGYQMTYEIIEGVYPLPVRTPAPALVRKPRAPKGVKVSGSLKKAAREYKQAYREVYTINPKLTYDGKWVRLQGVAEGVSTKRLRELTAQLKNRKG